MSANNQPQPAGPPDQLAPELSPERRRRIIDGAAIMFVRDGYEGASMAQIAAAANVSKGTLYNYFPSKQALFAAFVQSRCNRLIEQAFGEPSETDTLAAELKRIGATMLTVMLSPDGVALFRVVVMEAVKFPELARSFFNAGPQTLVDRMADWLTLQCQAGVLRVPDPQFAAEQFFALSQTRMLMRARIDASYNATQSEIDKVVDGAVQVFLAAYGHSTTG